MEKHREIPGFCPLCGNRVLIEEVVDGEIIQYCPIGGTAKKQLHTLRIISGRSVEVTDEASSEKAEPSKDSAEIQGRSTGNSDLLVGGKKK